MYRCPYVNYGYYTPRIDTNYDGDIVKIIQTWKKFISGGEGVGVGLMGGGGGNSQ